MSMKSNDIRLNGALNGLNPFLVNNSASRAMMDASHLAQAVVLETPDRMDISSGMDFEYAKYTFDVRIHGEEDQSVRILKILRKYTRTAGDRSINNNPVTYVLYENLDTGVIDVTEVPTYHYAHTTFGFKYRFTRDFENLREMDIVPCGTVLAIPPSIDNKEGQYAFGLEAICAFGSFPEVIEDGICVSESFAKRMTTRIFGESVINYGKEGYLLNLYGDRDNYKPFPDIGEKIRPDGLLYAFRKLDAMLSPVEMTPESLMEFDPIFDRLVYAEPNATVVDIQVNHSHDSSQCHLPEHMGEQPSKYYTNHSRFYRDLDKFYYDIKKKKHDRLVLSPHLHQLIVSGMKIDSTRLKKSNKQTYRREEIEEYRVSITYERELPLLYAAKCSDLAGGKGVITRIKPDHLMPIDRYGRRVEVAVDDNQQWVVKKLS